MLPLKATYRRVAIGRSVDRQYRAPVESGLEVLDLGGGCQVCNAADRGVAGEHFADNDIDVSVLPHLPDADLEKIGVSRPRLRSRGDPSERVATRIVIAILRFYAGHKPR